MPEKIVIFDLDGTLHQTHLFSLEATKRAAAVFGLRIPGDKEMIDFFGETGDDYFSLLYPGLSPEKRKELRLKNRAIENELITKNAKLFPGVKDMLNELASSDFGLYICSNASERYIRLITSTLEIEEYFIEIRGKHPEKNKDMQVAEILRESGYSFAVMVGDTVYDFEAAKANGIPSIGVTYGYGLEQIPKSDYVAEDVPQILGHIRRCEIFYRIEKMLKKPQDRDSIVLGINGVDTSGKTQFARHFEKYLKAKEYQTELIHLDDFHNPRAVRLQGPDEISAYINNAFNLGLLESELLAPIKRGEAVDKEMILLGMETDSFDNKKRYKIAKNSIVILEGTLLFREPISEYLDFRIYLDISFEQVLKRAEERDVPKWGKAILQKYEEKYIPIQKWYLNKYLPKKISEVVINNTDYDCPVIIE